MKKKYLILLIAIFFTTGCTCEYNLKINNNTYSEEIILTAENNNETNNLNNKWTIPVNKEEYNIGLDPSSSNVITGDVYKYNISGNKLSFNNTFTISGYQNSSAVSNCYNKITVTNYSDSTVLSTSQNVLCFDKYPSLSNVVVNIIVDRPVKNNNADTINGNTYTWNINKNNASNKSINLVLDNSNNTSIKNEQDNNEENINKKRDYSMYIFAGILLIVFLLGYFIFNKIRSKDEEL